MPSPLESLSGPGKPLIAEPPDAREFGGLVRSGLARLRDAQRPTLALESQFDFGYDAAQALCFAALRWHGWRSKDSSVVFQVLPHTLGLGPEVWRVLNKGYEIRNLGQYEGVVNVGERIVQDLINACQQVAAKLGTLPPLDAGE